MVCNTYLRISSFGDSLEFAFFGALTSVGALFVFHRKEKEKNMKSTDFFTKHKNKLIGVGIIVLIALIVIISVVFGTANNNDRNNKNECGTNVAHDWVNATCKKAKHCALCGLENGDIGSHRWIKATCVKPKHCSLCGLEEGGVESSHLWIKATCVKPKYCSLCGLEEGGVVSSHLWIKSSCEKPKYCSLCGLEGGEVYDHNYWQGKCTICNAKIENIILPKIPVVTVSGSDLFKITSLSYTMEKYDNNSFYLHFIYSGEKAMGSGYGKIEFKILDSDGYVVYTSYLLTEKLSPGDKIRNVDAKIWGEKFSYNESYTIVITNTYNK